MKNWEDYYKLLQVDFMAEPDIITAAYKNLAKKYHPDRNSNRAASEIMKQINHAYETLTDPEKRKQYNIKWLERHNANNTRNFEALSGIDILLASKAKHVLDAYFECIMEKDFAKAYHYISDSDKKSITKQEFIKWQDSVSKVYQLKSAKTQASKYYKKKMLKEAAFDEVIDFTVTITETNLVMGRNEEDTFTKQVVFEHHKWHVYIGYKKLSPYISKYEKLSNLTQSKRHLVLKGSMKRDYLTGYLSKKSFLERAFLEIERYNRYGNKFSLIVCQIVMKEESTPLTLGSNKRFIIKTCAELIASCTRVLDVPCRWNDTTFFILLPETDHHAMLIVIEKIKQRLSTNQSLQSEWCQIDLSGFENTAHNTSDLLKDY